MVNDFDIEEEVVEVENRLGAQLFKQFVTDCKVCILINCNFLHCYIREENLLKISRRVKEYKVEILNPPREGKKLLVLDVDYTLFGEFLCNLWIFLFKSLISLPDQVS